MKFSDEHFHFHLVASSWRWKWRLKNYCLSLEQFWNSNSFLLSVDDHTTVNECKVTSSCSPSSPSSSPSSSSSSPSLQSSLASSKWALITTPIDARSPHNFGPQTLHNVWRWTKIAIDRHWPLYNCHQFPFGVMWLQQCNDN